MSHSFLWHLRVDMEGDAPAIPHNRNDASRRTFLSLAGRGALSASMLATLGLTAYATQACGKPIIPTLPHQELITLTTGQWITLTAVQDHLLPSEAGSPGAKDVNATGYLDAALAGTDITAADVAALKIGVLVVEEFAQKQGKTSFARLNEAQREAVLRKIETFIEGEAWLTQVMTFTLEALLGDPIYGGNPKEIGWQWLQPPAAFPRPPHLGGNPRR